MKKLPHYICTDCAEKERKKQNITKSNYGYTLHEGKCELCGETGYLATLQDFCLKPITNIEQWD